MSPPARSLGASQVAAAIGVHPYSSPLDVYLEIVEGVRFSGNEASEWGVRLENTVAVAYLESQRAKGPYFVLDRSGAVFAESMPWARATPDRIAIARGEQNWLVEVKTTGARNASRWGSPGTGFVPIEYQCQCQWQLWVWGEATGERLERVDVPVLFGGQRFAVYRVNRDEELIAKLVRLAERFWVDHVEARVPPPANSTEDVLALAKALHGRRGHTDEVAESGALGACAAGLYMKASERRKQAALDLAYAGALLKKEIGGRLGIRGPGWVATWRSDKNGKRTLRVKAEE